MQSDLPIHLGEKLVDGLISIGMDLGACSLGSNSVNLINEDHGRSTDLCSTCNQHKQLELGVPGRYLGGIKQWAFCLLKQSDRY